MRISNEELAQALAANLDDEGKDVGLETWVESWTDAERARAHENLRRSVEQAQRTLRVPPH